MVVGVGCSMFYDSKNELIIWNTWCHSMDFRTCHMEQIDHLYGSIILRKVPTHGVANMDCISENMDFGRQDMDRIQHYMDGNYHNCD